MAVIHIASSFTERFDFVFTSRRDHEIQPDFIDYLSRLLRIRKSHQALRDALITFIVLNILLDAYPPNIYNKNALPFYKLVYLTKFNSL